MEAVGFPPDVGRATPGTATRAWWLAHAGIPALLAVALVAVLALGGVDRAVVAALYDPAGPHALLGALHGIERGLIAGVALAGIALLAWRRWRRPASYLLVCMALTAGAASVGKHATNMDCPKDLADHGGRRAAVGLFEDRPDDWPRAECFPAGHSSAAFAFVALYFLLGARAPRRRWLGLAASLALGLLFASTQWARGMHFPSHDVASAAIAWAVALCVYAGPYRRRLWARDAPAAR